MRYEEFVAEVEARAGFEDTGEAERVIAVVGRVLGERLLPDERLILAAAVPEEVARRITSATYARDFDLSELYDRVARATALRHDFGVEHTQAVCQVIADLLDDDARRRLEHILPPEFHPLFERRRVGSRPPRPVHATPGVEPGAGSTLATGRPGSRHAVSEARADKAHSQSVARSDDPHGDTKISGARGLTQERLGDSLAEGKPGPASPVSDTKR